MHFPYTDACIAQVVVAWTANLRNGRVSVNVTLEAIAIVWVVFGISHFLMMFLPACIGITFGLILYLFYWNRFVAYLIGLVIRLMWWKSSDSSAWVEIGMSSDVSLTVCPILSVLQGLSISHSWRVEYSSRTCDTIPVTSPSKSPKDSLLGPTGSETQPHNTTSAAHVSMEGMVCWFAADSSHLTAFLSEKPFTSASRCRLQLSLEGVQWFLYNRTASYNDIVSRLMSDFRPLDDRGSVGNDHSSAGTFFIPRKFYPPFIITSRLGSWGRFYFHSWCMFKNQILHLGSD